MNGYRHCGGFPGLRSLSNNASDQPPLTGSDSDFGNLLHRHGSARSESDRPVIFETHDPIRIDMIDLLVAITFQLSAYADGNLDRAIDHLKNV